MKECPINTFCYKLKVYKINSPLRQAELVLACCASGRCSVRRTEGQRVLCCAEAEAPTSGPNEVCEYPQCEWTPHGSEETEGLLSHTCA